MKILHLIYDHINNPWVGGGGAVRCFEINRRLAKKGHDITVVSGKYPGVMEYEQDGIKYKFLGSSKNYILSVFSYAYWAAKFLRKYAKDYEIVIEDFAPWNPVFSFRFHPKAIIQVHHRESFKILQRYLVLGLPFYLIEKFYPKCFKYHISVSPDTKDKFNLNAQVIPNGISDSLLKVASQNGDYLGYIGRIDIYNKGLDIILKASRDLDRDILIAGKGKDLSKMKKMISDLNISNRVKYIGYLSESEKIAFISNSKLLLMPSRFEGQGIIALEAAALGKPIIVSDIPELRYVTENGFGISFRYEDVESLKQAIKYLLNNEFQLEEMGRRGRQYAAQFTWDKISDEYEKYLLEVIEG